MHDPFPKVNGNLKNFNLFIFCLGFEGDRGQQSLIHR